MKTSLFFVLAALFLFGGCSTTHYLKYAKSDEQFYEDYNNSAGHKEIEVVLKNDSTLCRDNHSIIRNDTLYIFEEGTEQRDYILPNKDIKSMNYLTNDYKTADVLLHNGEKLKAEGITILKDSISFTGITEILYKKPLVPVDELKMVTYKNHWRGIINGALAGILLGGIVGTTGWVFHPMNGGMTEQFDQGSATIMGAFTGLLLGPVVGYFIGFNVNYQFSP